MQQDVVGRRGGEGEKQTSSISLHEYGLAASRVTKGRPPLH